MQIIKLDATESTNSFLKEWAIRNTLEDFTVVVTKNQTKGRGQRDGSWQTIPGKNLTFSVLKQLGDFEMDRHFELNMSVSLAVHDTLNSYQIPRIKVKWPNDIMSGSFKICGILIENIIAGADVRQAVIGIGLNVNQTDFSGLPHASSLRLQTGRNFDLEEILQLLIQNLQKRMLHLVKEDAQALFEDYQSKMFRNGLASTFQSSDGAIFGGVIKGVSQAGKLLVRLEDEAVIAFDNKEIRLLI